MVEIMMTARNTYPNGEAASPWSLVHKGCGFEPYPLPYFVMLFLLCLVHRFHAFSSRMPTVRHRLLAVGILNDQDRRACLRSPPCSLRSTPHRISTTSWAFKI